MKTLAELIAARGIDEAHAARRLKRNAHVCTACATARKSSRQRHSVAFPHSFVVP